LVEGSKYLVVSEKGFHDVEPFLAESPSSLHSKVAPYCPAFKPRWVLYHSFICLGSLHLKKTPPMPVTFFMFDWLLDVFENIVLAAKPRQNDVAMTSSSSEVFLICIVVGVGPVNVLFVGNVI